MSQLNNVCVELKNELIKPTMNLGKELNFLELCDFYLCKGNYLTESRAHIHLSVRKWQCVNIKKQIVVGDGERVKGILGREAKPSCGGVCSHRIWGFPLVRKPVTSQIHVHIVLYLNILLNEYLNAPDHSKVTSRD